MKQNVIERIEVAPPFAIKCHVMKMREELVKCAKTVAINGNGLLFHDLIFVCPRMATTGR